MDQEALTVRMIHFTLQEFISPHPDIFSSPHSAMAEICLTYLNSLQVKALLTLPSPNTQSILFLEYYSIYRGVHVEQELSRSRRSLALEPLKEDYDVEPTKLILEQTKHPTVGRFYPLCVRWATGTLRIILQNC